VRGVGQDLAGSSSPQAVSYEPPAVKILGAVEDLTQQRLKKFGSSDGLVYNPGGQAITDASA
jgi:hypothetical protein